MNELEMLWKTYDFALGKVALLEDEYDFLLKEFKKFCIQQIGEEIEVVNVFDRSGLIELDVSNENEVITEDLLFEFDKITKDLESYYNKQLSSIKELKEYYYENPYEIPEERSMNVEAFTELLEVTVLLRDAMVRSTEDIKKVLTS